jgi:type III secretory pathway component EscT
LQPVVTGSSLLTAIEKAFELSAVDLGAWLLAWARALPAVALVPAFGLRALPLPARAAMGLMLAATIAPSLRPIAESLDAWPWLLLREVLNGLPVAITAATALWAATMMGGLVDNLRGVQERLGLPSVEPDASPLGAMLGMLVALLYLETGGPAHLGAALAERGQLDAGAVLSSARALAAGIEFSIAVAVPLLVTSLVVEVAALLVTRAAQPAPVATVLAPLRSIAILAVLAVLLDRIVAVLGSRIP